MNEVGPAYCDPATGDIYPLDRPRWCSASGGPLSLTPLPGLQRDEIERGRRSLWRYAAALPIEVARPVSLGEGCTPLVPHRWNGTDILFKLEWFAPTCSFKDRGTSVMISALSEQGVSKILEDSSGNGGASVAAYGAAANMQVTILAPAATPASKVVQMRAHGATVELVPGTRQDTAEEARRRASHIFYASHNWHPFFLQGTKTLAYELWEDLGFKAPDNVVMPAGAGSLILGCAMGFEELLRQGEISRLPRLFAAQPERCAPLCIALDPASSRACGTGQKPSLAEGAAIPSPVRMSQVVSAILKSGGSAIAISEREIRVALLKLAKQGFYVEPTSALAPAGLDRLLATGAIRSGETTVVILSGSGVKGTQAIENILAAVTGN